VISVFGSINLDLIFVVQDLPQPGQTVLAPSLRMEPGGKGANQAVAAARDGAAVMMAGAVGMDVLADAALAGLLAAGVDTSRVIRVAEATGCAAICTDAAGHNQIAVGSGANLQARAHQLEDALLGPGHTLLLQMEADPAQTAALIHRARGARLILNLAPALPMPTETLRRLDMLVVNEHEAVTLAGSLGVPATAAGLHAALDVTVVRTLGADGVEWAGEDAGYLPAYAIDVVDSTAAGDCFTGVLAAALDRGMALRPALLRANAAAALCCGRAGSQGSVPSRLETDARLGLVA
jgi:ribokinase